MAVKNTKGGETLDRFCFMICKVCSVAIDGLLYKQRATWNV